MDADIRVASSFASSILVCSKISKIYFYWDNKRPSDKGIDSTHKKKFNSPRYIKANLFVTKETNLYKNPKLFHMKIID